MVIATNGASEAESGLASGLVNTSQQLGGSLGIAGLVAFASARTSDGGVIEGFSAGFTGGAVIAALGALLAAALLASESPREPAAAGAAA